VKLQFNEKTPSPGTAVKNQGGISKTGARLDFKIFIRDKLKFL
jgi:hypothetical protein